MKTHVRLGLGVLALLGAQGCLMPPEDDGRQFREAIPRAEAIQINGPESAAASNQTQGFEALSGAQADEPWADGPWSYWYGFTRHVRSGVNKVTAAVLGSVWLIVHTQPTSVSSSEAIWGPYTDALEPVTYRLRVTRIAAKTYEYRLEGRPRTSADDADYVAVLFGTGFGRGHESHGDGSFTIDIDAARSLDPFAVDAKDSGKVTITHDLPPTITQNLFIGARTVKADVLPSSSEQAFSVASTTEEDGSGTLAVSAKADADDSGGAALEDVSVKSRWATTGAGRSDITISGGDLPTELGTVKATECWSESFQSVYVGYSANVTWAEAEGSESACVFASAE